MIRSLKNKFDYKLLAILAIAYFFIEIVLFLKFLYFKLYVQWDMKSSVADSLRLSIVDWLLVTIFMSFIAVTTKHFFEKRVAWWKVILIHLISSIILMFFIYGIGYGLDVVLGYMKPEEIDYGKIMTAMISSSDANLLIYLGLTGIIYTYYYFYKDKDAKNQQALLKNELLNSRLKLLTSQLHPHFFFNALNNISAIIKEEPDKAQTALVDLSDLIRELLNFTEEKVIPLEREVDISRKYTNLMKLKYQNKLRVEFTIEPGLLNALVPSLFVQPLIENSIKHGLSKIHKHITIRIEILTTGDQLALLVRNNGEPFDQNKTIPEESRGLRNLKERLTILYPQTHSFLIYNETETGNVVVKTVIPLRFDQQEVAI